MTEAPTIAGRLTGLLNANQSAYGFEYNPVGRLLQASSGLGKELFAFDPAGNISDAQTSNPNLQHNTIDDEPGIHCPVRTKSAPPHLQIERFLKFSCANLALPWQGESRSGSKNTH